MVRGSNHQQIPQQRMTTKLETPRACGITLVNVLLPLKTPQSCGVWQKIRAALITQVRKNLRHRNSLTSLKGREAKHKENAAQRQNEVREFLTMRPEHNVIANR